MPLIYQYRNKSIIQMSAAKIFNGKYQDFQIALQVNDADILEIQALNSKTNVLSSFSIDRDYLHEHPRFTNIFETPVQLFQYLQKSFDNVIFDEGQLEFTYEGITPSPRKITILLFEESAYSTIQTRLAQQQTKAKKLISQQNQKNDKLIQEIRHDTDSLKVKITQLQQKTIQIQNQINKIKG